MQENQNILDPLVFGYFQQAIEVWAHLPLRLRCQIMEYLNNASRQFFHWLYEIEIMSEAAYNLNVHKLSGKHTASKGDLVYDRRMPYIGDEADIKDVNRLRGVLKAYIYLLSAVQREQALVKEATAIKDLKKAANASKTKKSEPPNPQASEA